MHSRCRASIGCRSDCVCSAKPLGSCLCAKRSTHMADVKVTVSVAVDAVLLTVWKVVAGTITVVLLRTVTADAPGHEAARTPDAPKRARSERGTMLVSERRKYIRGIEGLF